MKPRPRGMSLVEVLVGAVILVLIFGIVLFVLRPAWHSWMRNERKSDAQQNSLIVVTRITQEMRNALAESVVVTRREVPEPHGVTLRRDSISFLSDQDDSGNVVITADGDPLWQKRVGFYHDGAAGQVRAVVMPLATPTVDPTPLTVDSFPTSPKDRIVARYVRSLALGWDTAPTLQIVVETERDGYDSRYESSVTPLVDAFASPAPSPSPLPSGDPDP